MAEWLSRVDVGHMYLYTGLFDRRNRIAERVAVMGIGTSIDYNAIIAFQRFVNFIDQSAFVVALENVALHPKAVHTVPDLLVDEQVFFANGKAPPVPVGTN